MANKQLMLPANRAFNSNGLAISGAQAKLYTTGTSTPANFYADSGLITSLGPTLTANGAGRFPTAYQNEVTPFRLKILDSDGAVLDDIDPFYFGYLPGATGPQGPIGPAGDVAKAADRTALAAITGQVSGATRFSAESGREGTFVWSSAANTTNVTNDPSQGIYVAPASDTSGASGAWVRKFDGPYHARWWGVIADNATDNVTAGQAAINAVSAFGGGELRFPVGITKHSGLTFKNKIQYRGSGRDTASTSGTVLHYTGTGDGVQVNNPINSSTAANISVEGITFKNASRNAGKGCFADTGSTDIKFRHCSFIGGDHGLILDQSELADVIECDFQANATSATSCIWLVDGADRNGGASGQFTNRISVTRCQLNGVATAYGILDDGGNAHSFTDNNYNGCLNHIRAASVLGLKISGGEFESAAQACVRFEATTLAGAGAGSCGSVYIGDGAEFVPATGQYCVLAQSLGNVTLSDVFFGSSTQAKFGGTGNVSAIYAIGCHNAGGGGATFDGRATNHWEVGNDGSTIAVRTNLAYSWGGTPIFNGSGVLQAAGVPVFTGDVTSAGGALALTIGANVVTYAKFQQVAASSLVGNATGSLANAAGITLAGGLAFSGSTLTAAGALTPTSVAIGSGTAITKSAVYTPSITPASVAAATVAEQTFTVTGLTTADKVIVNPPAIANSTGIAGARVSAADTLAIRFVNPTAGALTPTSGVYTVMALRS